MKGFIKRFVKLTVVCLCAAALMTSTVCADTGAVPSTGGAPGASGTAPTAAEPAIVGRWAEAAGTGIRRADFTVSYPADSGYNGKVSLIALYNGSKLASVGAGRLEAGSDGSCAAAYMIDIPDNADRAKCFVFDDFTSSKPAAPVYGTDYSEFLKLITNVPAFVVPDGAMGIRNSFESGLFQIFQNKSTYNIEAADDATAHSGTKYAKVSGRDDERTTMRVKLPTYDTGAISEITLGAFMRKPESVQGSVEFYVTVMVPGSSDTNQHLYFRSDPVTASDSEWHEVKHTFDLSAVTNKKDFYIVELGARTGTDGNYTYIDYDADDFTVLCPNAAHPTVFDDTKISKFKWDFEAGATADWVTENRKMINIADANKWTRTLNAQTLEVIDTSAAEFWNTTTTKNVPKALQEGARTTPPEGSSKMLAVTATQGDYANSHVSARIKLSRLDLVPGKTYNLSFWAFCNTKSRGLYTGLIKHSDSQDNPVEFYGTSSQTSPSGDEIKANTLAGGVINYSDEEAEYMHNYAAQIQRFWRKYKVTITPTADDFNGDGYCDLCFVLTEDRPTQQDWFFKSIYTGEKLYLDEIEITEAIPAEAE